MIFTPTKVQGAYRIDLERIEDDRGFFARAWCRREWTEHGLDADLAQCDISFNRHQGTLRGMHSQEPPHEETKLVRCTRGAIWDVMLDLRPGSPTYLRHEGLLLSAENLAMAYIPKGVYHGFLTLCDDCEVFYQMSQFYVPGVLLGVRWDDPAFGIHWPQAVRVISDRDRTYPNHETKAWTSCH